MRTHEWPTALLLRRGVPGSHSPATAIRSLITLGGAGERSEREALDVAHAPSEAVARLWTVAFEGEGSAYAGSGIPPPGNLQEGGFVDGP